MVAALPVETMSERRPARRWLGLGCLLVALVAAVTIGLVTRGGPPEQVFYDQPGAVSMWGTANVGHSLTVGMTDVKKGAGSEPVTVVSAIPRIVANSARARVTVRVCRPNVQREGAIGSIAGNLARDCTRLTPATGATLPIAERSDPPTVPDQLIVTIEPTRPGVVLVWGLDIVYEHDGHLIWQNVGQVVKVRTPAPNQGPPHN